MPDAVIYEWNARQDLRDWKVEGHGELLLADDGALHVRTLNHGPLRRASNAWLKDLQLPEAFEVQWDYRHEHLTGGSITHEGVMLLFNALPIALRTLWEDPRPNAAYSDIFSYRKMVCYSYGFCRSPFGLDSQLRKLGGYVPPEAGESRLEELTGKKFDELTVLSKSREPAAAGQQYHTHRVRREGEFIRVWCDDTLVHDWRDAGQYQFHDKPLRGGHLGFRNWAGYIDSFYRNLAVRKIG